MKVGLVIDPVGKEVEKKNILQCIDQRRIRSTVTFPGSTTKGEITTEAALNAMIPSLTLQPLLENAVYHGIEPTMAGGTVTIDCTSEEDRLLILITNPVSEIASGREGGNKIALKNIRGRLKRQFGGDVKISVHSTSNRFTVSIDAPLVRPKKANK